MPALSAVPLQGDFPTVVMGPYSYEVVPQKIGRLRRRLGKALGGIEALRGETLAEFIEASLEQTYGVLKVFVPDLMPLHEFCGYRSQEAMDAEDDDDDGEWGPTVPEIINAFEAVMKVNRLDLLGHLRSVVSPELIRAFIAEQVAQTLKASQTSSSASSPSTPGPPSPSIPSGTTPPISEPSLA